MIGLGRRWLASAFGAVALVVAPSAPALAHGSQPLPDQAFYETSLTTVTPVVPGVTFRVDRRGEWLEVTNRSPDPVLVLGYLREPYLRVSASGVEENQNSPTTNLNRSLFVDALPGGLDGAGGAPAWKRTSATTTARWHDHRIHWMGADRPPVVRADPTHPHAVGAWTVHALVGKTPVTVHGTLKWLGRPAANGLVGALPWVLAVVITVATIFVVGGLRRQRTPTEPPPDRTESGPAEEEPAKEPANP